MKRLPPIANVHKVIRQKQLVRVAVKQPRSARSAAVSLARFSMIAQVRSCHGAHG